jgi:hypothetical protein
VLEVIGDRLRFEVEEGEGIPGAWEGKYFEVTDSRMPPIWNIDIGDSGVLYLAPARWWAPDFWHALDDDEPPTQMTWNERRARCSEAWAAFNEDVKAIVDADRAGS